MEEVATFHNGEQNDLEGIIKNIKSKASQPTRNNPLELRCIKTKPEALWELIWDPIKDQAFWHHEIVVPSPHAKNNEID
jgi:hypothetical protein